jgi:hypothetical protein
VDFNALLTAIMTNGIGAACAAAFLWFAYYRETHSLPEIMKTFTDVNKEIQASFEARSNKTVDLFTAMVHEERVLCQKWHDEHVTRLDRLFEEAKENRHALQNVLQQMSTCHAIEAERQRQRLAEERR